LPVVLLGGRCVDGGHQDAASRAVGRRDLPGADQQFVVVVQRVVQRVVQQRRFIVLRRHDRPVWRTRAGGEAGVDGHWSAG
jgi:predicted sugar kinase